MIKIDFIVFWSVLGLTILFGALISVWRPFSVFMSIGIVVDSVIYTFWQYKKWTRLKNVVEDQRYIDAYMYADENNLSFNPENFTYSKKDERFIRRTQKNARLLFLVGIVLIAFGVFLTIFTLTHYC